MIEILSIFKQSEETIFRTIFLLDLYLKSEKSKLKTEELHIIGITIMFISSKLHELKPLTMKEIIQQIGKNKFSKKEILEKEKHILGILKFNINQSSLCCYLTTIYNLLGLSDKISNSLIKYSFTLLKMYCYSYDIINVYSYEHLSLFSTIIALKLFGHSDKNFQSNIYIVKLLKISKIDKNNLVENLNYLRDTASNFKNSYSYNKLQNSRSN